MAIDYRKEVDSGFDRKRIVEASTIDLLRNGIPVEIIEKSPYFIFKHQELLRNLRRGHQKKEDQIVEIYNYYGVDPEKLIIPERFFDVHHPIGGELYPYTEQESIDAFKKREELIKQKARLIRQEQKNLSKEKEKLLKVITRYKVKYPIIDIIIEFVNELDSLVAEKHTITDDDLKNLYRKYSLSSKNNEKYNNIYNEYQKLVKSLEDVTSKYNSAMEGNIATDEYNDVVQNLKELESEIVLRNTKLVNGFIRQKYNDLLVETDDLFQVCYLAMWESIQKYDYRKGKFSSYAYAFMDTAVKSHFKELTGFQWDVYWENKKIKRLLQMVEQLTGEKVTVIDLLNYGLLSMSEARAFAVADLPEEFDMSDILKNSDEDYDEYEVFANYEYYHGDDEVLDFEPYPPEIYDSLDDNPEINAMNEDLKKQISVVLEELTEREKEVIIQRFGLLDGKPRTLKEVGETFNVHRQRISQIEAKALRKLLNPSRSYRFKDYKLGISNGYPASIDLGKPDYDYQKRRQEWEEQNRNNRKSI